MCMYDHFYPTSVNLQVASLAHYFPLIRLCEQSTPDSSLCRAAAPRFCPLQLLLPDCIYPLQLMFTVSVRFGCCSPIASASTAAFRTMPNVLEHSPQSSRFSKLKYEGRASCTSLVPPHQPHLPLPSHYLLYSLSSSFHSLGGRILGLAGSLLETWSHPAVPAW